MSLYRMPLHLAWAAAAVLTFTAPPTLAAQQAWDQQKVTQIASQLAEAVSGVYNEFRKQPERTNCAFSRARHANSRVSSNRAKVSTRLSRFTTVLA